MQKLTTRQIAIYGGLVMLALIIVRSWDAIVGFIGIVLTAIIPLILGAAIAYVVSIPTGFIERHLLPNSRSKAVSALRKPVSLITAIMLILVGLFLASSVFIPAFVETMAMVQKRSTVFIEMLLRYPLLEPVKAPVEEFMHGDIMKTITSLDIVGFFQGAMGGTVASFGTQLFGVVSVIMTGFFGLLFSFILLTDTTGVGLSVMNVIEIYAGRERTEKLALVMGVADSSFHNFIVRQFLEAAILGTVGTVALLVMGYDYALGVGVLMGLAALVPIVGYPVGLIAGAFMVVISNPWMALVYIIVVGFAQMLEATFVLPHIGDPRTVLPPVWTTIGVTIGGGVAGFVGMLVAIPTASTIRQLVLIDLNRRRAKSEAAEQEAAEQDAAER